MSESTKAPEPGPDKAAEKLTQLRKTSDELKTRIEEAKKRNDMPLDAALGNPKWEQQASDGHLDIPDDDED